LEIRHCPEARLKGTFERWWSDLDQTIKSMPKSESHQEIKLSAEDLLGEILEGVRRIERSISEGVVTLPTGFPTWFTSTLGAPLSSEGRASALVNIVPSGTEKAESGNSATITIPFSFPPIMKKD